LSEADPKIRKKMTATRRSLVLLLLHVLVLGNALRVHASNPPPHSPLTNITTDALSSSPVTSIPSKAPISMSPTVAPVISTEMPTVRPSSSPVVASEAPTSSPSSSPVTFSPTLSPASMPLQATTTTQPSMVSRPPTCNMYDGFGVQMIYRGISNDPFLLQKDWDSGSWYEHNRTISSPLVSTDPFDSRLQIGGSGGVSIADGKATLSQTPSLFIENAGSPDKYGWSDVEFTGYAKMLEDLDPKGNTGINMLVRTNHQLVVAGDGCDASLYWAHVNYVTGQASFTKEYFHDDEAIARSGRVTFDIGEFSSGLPIDSWIGFKFVAYTTHGENVKLELYTDISGDNEWAEVAAYTDKPGEWNATGPFPSTCNHTDGDTILGRRRYCALFNVGSSESSQGEILRALQYSMLPMPCLLVASFPIISIYMYM